MSFMNHAINNSATIVGQAASALTAPALLAVKFDANGKLVLPSAGDPCMGIVIADTEDVAAGADVHVQIKDIGLWKTGAAVARGAELTANASGKAITATSGAFILAIALEAASAADEIIQVQIVKAGYKSGGSVAPLTLAGLTDVAISNVAGGDAIVYDSSAQKYKNKALGLNDLSDVNITTPADSEKLTYDGTDSEWQNK